MARPQQCPCGSGQWPNELRDARGISCGYVCDRCEKAKRAQFRPDIFEDGAYWADEPIDED